MFAPRYFASAFFARVYFPKGSDLAPSLPSVIEESHRFISTVVPDFQDLSGVQRFLQRMMDDMSRAMNPVRSVADGGTGVDTLEPGDILAGAGSGTTFNRVPGNKTTTRMFLVMEGDGSNATTPFWAAIRDVDVPVTTGPTSNVLVGTSLVVAGTSQVIHS